MRAPLANRETLISSAGEPPYQKPYTGNNPNKWLKERDASRRHLENVREYLKRRGILVEG